MAIPEFGDGDGGGDGGDEAEVVDADNIGVVEVVNVSIAARDAPDCISPIIPPRAEVIEAGNAVEPDGVSICVSGHEPSLFP